MAAATVFERVGYHRATVDQVSERAGVTKGALYGHFDSKYALAVAVLDEHERALVRARARMRMAHRHPLQVLVDLGHLYCGQPAARRMLFEAPFCDELATERTERWTRMVRDQLHQVRTRGVLRPDVDPLDAARRIVAALVGVCLMALVLTRPGDVAARVESLWRAWLPSLVRPEAARTLRLGPPVECRGPAHPRT